MINNKWCKILIILIFGFYLAGACYGVTQIKEGLERRKLSRADSYSVEFFDREDEYYREFPYRMQVVITGDLNYSDPLVQEDIEELTRNLENTSYVTSSLYTESWLRSFLSFVDRNNEYLNLTLDNEQEFINAVKTHWLFPGNPFSLDVKFNDNDTRIIASRFLIQAVNITDTNHEKEMVRDLREICKRSVLNATIFHPYFVFFDQFELVRPTSLQAMIIGAAIMMIVSFIFIPNILCSLWVAFSVISIELGVAGYMALWDVNLDSISMINLIMCIGFSVDFTAHICYTYMSSQKRSPKARVRESLHSLGLPILQGSSSTILGILALLLAQSYIFLVFFKMVFLVVFFGAMHGLFLLPVLLSLFGPGSWQSWISKELDNDGVDKNDKTLKIDKTYRQPYYIHHSSEADIHTSYGLKSFACATHKGHGEEKDLGLGTSGEDTSESSSSHSQRHQIAVDDNDNTQKVYEERWRRFSYQDALSHNTRNQFQIPTSHYTQDLSDQEYQTDHINKRILAKARLSDRYVYDNYSADIQTHKQPYKTVLQNDFPTDRFDKYKHGYKLDHNYPQQRTNDKYPASTLQHLQLRRSSVESAQRNHHRWPDAGLQTKYLQPITTPASAGNMIRNYKYGEYPAVHNTHYRPANRRSSSYHDLCYPVQHKTSLPYEANYYHS